MGMRLRPIRPARSAAVLIGALLLREVERIAAGVADGPFVARGFILGLFGRILAGRRKNVDVHRRRQGLARLQGGDRDGQGHSHQQK